MISCFMNWINTDWLYPLPFSLMLQLNQELEQDESRILQHQVGSPITNSPPGRSLFHAFCDSWTQFLIMSTFLLAR